MRPYNKGSLRALKELIMPRINFQQQLVALKDKLLAMAALWDECEEAV